MAKDGIEITPEVDRLLKSLGTRWIDMLEIGSEGTVPPAGPYVVYTQRLSKARKLYTDVQGAFVASLVSNFDG